MSKNDAQLQQVPGYLAALHGATPVGVPFPNPTSQAQRIENARYVARQAGVDASGVVDPKTGRTTDPNAKHWYDPGVLGPIVVGGSAAGVGLLGGPWAGAAAASQGATGGTGLGAVGGAGVPSMPWTLPAEYLGPAEVGASGLGADVASTMGVPGTVGTSGGGLWGGLQKIGGGLFGGGKNMWGPLAASSGLDLLGGYLSSRAANKAAETQLEYGNRALDFEKGRYADAQKNLAPYIANGQNANNTAASALMPTSGPAPTAANLGPQFMAPFQQNAQNNGSRMVQMRAPDGSTQAVPDFQVAHFTSRGATVVG